MKIFIFTLLFLWPFTAIAQDFAEPLQTKPSPVLIELFSSQGCPACPPADAYMKSLTQSDGVIALSCHVDYFPVKNDALGKKFCTDRQSKYIKQIKRRSHYTPQMMINGHMDVIGYEKQKVSAKIVQGRSERVSDINIQPKGQGVFDFSLPLKKFDGYADLWLAIYEKPHSVNMRGRNVTYYNVISSIMPLGQWGGAAINRAVFPIVNTKSAGFAIVAQDKVTGKVLAAGEYKL